MSKVVLVCGGRDYDDVRFIETVLDSLMPMSLMIHGGATGADTWAGAWAEKRAVLQK